MTKPSPICIVAAKRTPQGRFMGALAGRSALDLAMVAGQAVLQEIGPEEIDQVIVGNVLSAGLGMNLARQLGVNLNVPLDRPAFTVNMMCASGMQAVALAAQAIRTGQARTVLCGGTESMTNAPYLLDRARAGYKLGNGQLIDSLLRDGLIDSFSDTHMGLTAETIAEKFGISRAEQDGFAVQSQQRYARAHTDEIFRDELVTMDELEADEHPRPDTTTEDLAALAPAFKPDGTVTAGNASGINDGAAMLIVCALETAEANKWKPLALVQEFATVGCDPAQMGLGPIYATRKLFQKLDCSTDHFDTVEINEAFAAQTIACQRELAIDPARLNRAGGAIALGHPIGASGARIIVHLAHEIDQGRSRNALATLCVGGGMGSAVALTSPS